MVKNKTLTSWNPLAVNLTTILGHCHVIWEP